MSGSPLYDVTDEVEISKRDGSATYDSINTAAKDWQRDSGKEFTAMRGDHEQN